MTQEFSSDREVVRHMLATLAYRGTKTFRGAPPEFAAFRPAPSSRTPLEILAHVGDLFDWALSILAGHEVWHEAQPQEWKKEVQRFCDTLKRFDDYLAAGLPVNAPLSRLIQGPIADALTHVGQLAMLRHLSGAPFRGENYFKADIQAGRLGLDQAAPRREFD